MVNTRVAHAGSDGPPQARKLHFAYINSVLCHHMLFAPLVNWRADSFAVLDHRFSGSRVPKVGDVRSHFTAVGYERIADLFFQVRNQPRVLHHAMVPRPKHFSLAGIGSAIPCPLVLPTDVILSAGVDGLDAHHLERFGV